MRKKLESGKRYAALALSAVMLCRLRKCRRNESDPVRNNCNGGDGNTDSGRRRTGRRCCKDNRRSGAGNKRERNLPLSRCSVCRSKRAVCTGRGGNSLGGHPHGRYLWPDVPAGADLRRGWRIFPGWHRQ